MAKAHYTVRRTTENDKSSLKELDHLKALEWLREGHGRSLRLYIGDKVQTGTYVLNLPVGAVYAVMMDVQDVLEENNMPPPVYRQNGTVG